MHAPLQVEVPVRRTNPDIGPVLVKVVGAQPAGRLAAPDVLVPVEEALGKRAVSRGLEPSMEPDLSMYGEPRAF